MPTNQDTAQHFEYKHRATREKQRMRDQDNFTRALGEKPEPREERVLSYRHKKGEVVESDTEPGKGGLDDG